MIEIIRGADVPTRPVGATGRSAILIGRETVRIAPLCMGRAIVPPETWTEAIAHTVGEVMVVAQGQLLLHAGSETYLLETGDAALIGAEEWHSLQNAGAVEAVSVFAFATDDYPPTRTRGVTHDQSA